MKLAKSGQVELSSRRKHESIYNSRKLLAFAAGLALCGGVPALPWHARPRCGGHLHATLKKSRIRAREAQQDRLRADREAGFAERREHFFVQMVRTEREAGERHADGSIVSEYSSGMALGIY